MIQSQQQFRYASLRSRHERIVQMYFSRFDSGEANHSSLIELPLSTNMSDEVKNSLENLVSEAHAQIARKLRPFHDIRHNAKVRIVQDQLHAIDAAAILLDREVLDPVLLAEVVAIEDVDISSHIDLSKVHLNLQDVVNGVPVEFNY